MLLQSLGFISAIPANVPTQKLLESWDRNLKGLVGIIFTWRFQTSQLHWVSNVWQAFGDDPCVGQACNQSECLCSPYRHAVPHRRFVYVCGRRLLKWNVYAQGSRLIPGSELLISLAEPGWTLFRFMLWSAGELTTHIAGSYYSGHLYFSLFSFAKVHT